MTLRYVGGARVFRRLPARDLSAADIKGTAARTLQSADDLTRDLLASGLYVVDEPKAEPPKRKPKAK